MTGRDPIRPTLQDRAEAVPVDALGKAGQDARTGAELLAALERETTASLRRDPSRWRHAQAADPDHWRSKPRRSAGLAEAGPGRCRACGATLDGRRLDAIYCSDPCRRRGARAGGSPGRAEP